jgi:FHS family L-fucose permease-like MFS transporter
VLGVVGIFAYVGADVSIGSYLISLLENLANISAVEASHKLSIYWGGAMVGRFIGSALMAKLKPNLLLAFNALVVVLLIVFAITCGGTMGMWAILAVGLFNSIMFPTIFSLALNGLGHQTSQGSGYLCMGIVGGALIPFVQGAVADHMSLLLSFTVPLVCYIYIAFYGLKGSKPVH